MLTGMIAAITGANGFIGRRACSHFAERGWTVRSVVRSDFAAAALDRLFDGADVVIHAAGATRAPSANELLASNVGLTRTVMEQARAAGVGRVLFISSQAAAGPAASPDRPVDEDTPEHPIEAYGRSKLEAERVVRSFDDVPSVIVRPGAVYGPGDRDFLAMFRLARLGIAIHPGNREQSITIIHVDDLIDGIELAATKSRALGATWFMANESPTDWRTLFRLAAAAANRTLRLDANVPAPVVRAGALIGDVVARFTGKAGLLTGEKVALGAPRYWLCSSARARQELGFSPRIELPAGIAATYAWYREAGWL